MPSKCELSINNHFHQTKKTFWTDTFTQWCERKNETLRYFYAMIIIITNTQYFSQIRFKLKNYDKKVSHKSHGPFTKRF